MEDWKKEIRDLEEWPQGLNNRQQLRNKSQQAAENLWSEKINKFLNKVVSVPFKELTKELRRYNKRVSCKRHHDSRTLQIRTADGTEMRYTISIGLEPGDTTIWEHFEIMDESGLELMETMASPIEIDNKQVSMSNAKSSDIIRSFMEWYRHVMKQRIK